ncbi:MAG: sulfide/dihydroorotate dehydrogenase-like FAD/NAD-binding protein [Capsulimonadaceae bacterium]|nr:sulfide/dihydroorotate dehydrogenase-like FAD/NAD-binding protein [Capsulimonadaceae bacterium]
MFKIVEARYLSKDVKLFRIHAPRVAKKQKPGQFVILRVNDHGERIPITIAASDAQEETITIVAQGIGKTTKLLNTLETGDSIADVVGPLGKPTDVEKFGTVVVIGGGVGTAIAYPTANALHDAGNRVISIIGARTKDLVIFEDELRAISDPLIVTTDDGSYGVKAVVTVPLQELIDSPNRPDYVLAIGPIPMMRAVAETTRAAGIKTVVSLNAIMVDGTGMCGGCRVAVGGKSQFACVDGPEFDAHQVDFALLAQRGAMYRDKERVALTRFEEEHACKLLEAAKA